MTPKTADGCALRCALASRMRQVTACCFGQATSRPVDQLKSLKTGPWPESRDAWGPQPVSASFVPLDSISYDGPIGRPGPSTASLRMAEVGGLSTGRLTMALAALEFAGSSFLPDARRLDIMRGFSSSYGNVAGLESTMAGVVRILQGGGSVAQAARLLLEGLSSHACDRACRSAPRLWSVPVDSPSEQPMRLPLCRFGPRKRAALRLPSPGGRSPRNSKRQRGNPRPPIAGPDSAADGQTYAGAHKPDGGSGAPPWLFPRNADRRVEHFHGGPQSMRGRGAFTQRMVDGVFVWFLSLSVTARSRGGFRVLSSMRADALVGAAAGTSWGVCLWDKAIKDGLILSGGLSVMPVRAGRVWRAVVVRHMDKVYRCWSST